MSRGRFWDFLPTAAELSAANIPAGVRADGFSLVSFLKGGSAPKSSFDVNLARQCTCQRESR